MAIYVPGDDFYPADDVECFLCGVRVTEEQEPVAMWAGANGVEIFLHAGCAGSFVLRLARDAWQLERDAGDGAVEFTMRR